MFLSQAITQYILYAKAEQGLSARTITVYQDRLQAFERWCDARPIASLDVEGRFNNVVIRQYLVSLTAQNNLRPRTVRNRICPLRSMGTYLVSQAILTENPAKSLTLPKKDAATRHVVSDDDLAKLLEGVERQKAGKRLALERAMLYTLAFSGVRWSELLDLRVGNFDAGAGTLLVAHGKGEKSRLLYPTPECVSTIAVWLAERAKMGCKHDFLFAFDIARPMGDAGTRAMFEDIKARSGLGGADHIKPHAFRRGMATRMIRAGADILSVGAALGHSQIATTLIYTAHRERPAERMRDTASLQPAKPVSEAPAPPASFARSSDRSKPDPTKPTRAAYQSQRRRTPAK